MYSISKLSYVFLKDKCREVVCPSMHYFNKKKQQCEEIFQKIRKRTYVAYYKVTIIDEKLDEDDCSMSCVSDDSYTVEYGICSYIEITLTNSGIDCCYLLEYHYPKDIKNVTHREYIVGISLLAFSSHNQRTYVEVLSSPFEVNRQKDVINRGPVNIGYILLVQPISHKALDLASDFVEWDFTNYYDSYYDRYDYQYYNEESIMACASTHPAIQVVSNFFCPRIKLKFNEVELSTNHLIVLNNNIQYDINTVLQNEEYFLVCVDVYMASSINFVQEVVAVTNKIETLLSLVCSIASITSLTLTLVVYILLKDLRTLPGLQQMMLSFHLLVAHALYLFGINAESTETLCAAVGLLTHYFWLGSIMWMHICTLDMFRVFYYNNQSTSNRLKQFTRYVIYSVSLPSLLVAINIVNFFSSDENQHGYLGYGGESCYIIEKTMVLYTFAIPVGVLLLLNIILFSVVIYQLEMALEVKSETRKNRPMLVIYTKMSCLTGITWIFGFAYQWTLVDFLSYAFIILNASQGLFIFLSFGLNRHVRSKISEIFCRPNEQTTQKVEIERNSLKILNMPKT